MSFSDNSSTANTGSLAGFEPGPAHDTNLARQQYELLAAGGYDLPDDLRMRVHGTVLAGALANPSDTFAVGASFDIAGLSVRVSIDEVSHPWPAEAPNARLPHLAAMTGWLLLNNPREVFRLTWLNNFLSTRGDSSRVRLMDGAGAWLQQIRAINEPLIVAHHSRDYQALSVNPAVRVTPNATDAWYNTVGADLVAINERRYKSKRLYLGEHLTPGLTPR